MIPPLPLAEAQAQLLAGVAPLPAETRKVIDARGHYLAEPLVARRTQPAADLSAMDGYAMADGGGPWKVVGESAAGHPFAGRLGPGEAVRISTGALMPEGADAVLLQEDATREADQVSATSDTPSTRHVRRKGFDFAAGDTLLPAGTRMDAAQVALAYAAGHAELSVHRAPRLAVIDTGDELSANPESCAVHQLPMSNGAMIGVLARPFVQHLDLCGPVPDKVDVLAGAFASFEGADVIVTSGGASVGDHDVLRPALEAWGAEVQFWRVKMKPGKPVLVARKGETLLLGLPGNPVSSFVTATMFLLPVLRRLGGAPNPLPVPVEATLARDLPAGGGRLEFIRARLEGGAVLPLDERDSSALRSLAAANALIEWPTDAPAAPAGTRVKVYRLENGGNA